MHEDSSPYIDTWKDWQPGTYIERRSATTDAKEPATGLTGITFRVSASVTGAAIGALTGIAATEVGTTGRYRGTVDLATLTSELPEATYPHGTPVWLQVFKPGDVESEPVRKTIRRYPT